MCLTLESYECVVHGLSLVFLRRFSVARSLRGEKFSLTLDFWVFRARGVPTSGCVYTSRINFIPWFNFILGSFCGPVGINFLSSESFLFLFGPVFLVFIFPFSFFLRSFTSNSFR